MLNYVAHGNVGSVKYQTSASLFILYRPYKGHFKFRLSNLTVTTILPLSQGTWNGLLHDPLANFEKYPYRCISIFFSWRTLISFVLVFCWRRVFSGDFLVPLNRKKTQKWIITKINWNISLTHSVIYFFDYIHFCTLSLQFITEKICKKNLKYARNVEAFLQTPLISQPCDCVTEQASCKICTEGWGLGGSDGM